jgi:hypothetical protein
LLTLSRCSVGKMLRSDWAVITPSTGSICWAERRSSTAGSTSRSVTPPATSRSMAHSRKAFSASTSKSIFMMSGWRKRPASRCRTVPSGPGGGRAASARRFHAW